MRGTFINATVVRLTTGQLIVSVERHANDFCTGWLAGILYVSHDGGATWASSDLVFRCY